MRAVLAAMIVCLSFGMLALPSSAGFVSEYGQQASVQHRYHVSGARTERAIGHRSFVKSADVFCQAYAPCAHPQALTRHPIGTTAVPLRTNPVSFAREVVHQAGVVAWRGATEVYELVTAAAIAAGVPENIAHAVVRYESRYNPHAVGDGGASLGLGQVKCQTARGLGFSGRCSELFDPATNLRYAMTYLRAALDTAPNNRCAGISAYNHGIKVPRPYCTGYGRAILALAR